MTHSIGKTIRRLRRERGLTQEELAEQLGVTSQAVSKWENETGMPDISQIVPLASILRVSTDVLFGTVGTDSDETAFEIIRNARSLLTDPVTLDSARLCYERLQEGLERYPGSTPLLMQSLEIGFALSYPNDDLFDEENVERIFRECIRQANIVISYGKNTTDILRTRMILVMLYSAYGEFDLARREAGHLPVRADMTNFSAYAIIMDFEKNPEWARNYRSWDIACHFEALLNSAILLAADYEKLEEYGDAERVLLSALGMIDAVCGDEPVRPSFHQREFGDIYCTLARLSVKMGSHDDALDRIERMVHHDTAVCGQYIRGMTLETPLLRHATIMNYFPVASRRERLLAKLSSPDFEALRENERFKAALDRAKNM